MKMSQAIEGFKISALSDGYALVTIKGYLSSLGTLKEFLGDPEVSDITYDDLKQFMLYLRTDYKPERKSKSLAPLATASFHRYWKAIRSFFKWANRELKIPRPDLELKMPLYTNKEIVPFTEDEIKRMIKACNYSKTINDGIRKPYQFRRPTAERDRALLMILLDTGIRSGECARLKIRDVNLENGEVHVMPYHIGKTKPRTVYLGKITRKMLWKYLSNRPDKRDDDPLFVTLNNHPMNQASIRNVIGYLGDMSNISNAHPHKFRHTFAIQYLRNGGDIFTLQRLLGHATLEMVKHYLALADTDSADAHRKASPVDRWRL